MTTTVGIATLATAAITNSPLELGVGGRFFLEPGRIKAPDQRGGTYSFEVKTFVRSFPVDYHDLPVQITGMLPVGPVLNEGKEYAYVQFSTGAYFLSNYSPTDSSELKKDLIGLRPLCLTANWRHDKKVADFIGIEFAVEVPLYESESGVGEFSRSNDFFLEGAKVHFGFNFGAVMR